MRILILGGDGMLGHRLLLHLQARHQVKVTLRRELAAYAGFGLFHRDNAYPEIDCRYIERLLEVVGDFGPQAIVNCVGIVKQRAEAKAAIPSLEINALLPHRLNVVAALAQARLVHLGTDCVFSGSRGGYREEDAGDADDLYGRSKLLGEVGESPCITLRTSIIGPELSRKSGLLEWFLAQKGGSIKGFTGAIFSGFTTSELSRVIERVLVEYPRAAGLYHVSNAPISKYDLLSRLNVRLAMGMKIVPWSDFHCDRSLDSTRFRTEFAYTPPSWDEMIEELARDLNRE